MNGGEGAEIALYGNASPNVVKVMIACEEMGLSWRLEPIDVIAGDQYQPGFLALNPNGRVPVIVDRAAGATPVTVFDSSAILLHLAFTRDALLPPAPEARATVLQWVMFAASGVGPMFGQFTHFTRFHAEAGDYPLKRFRAEALRLGRVLDAKLDRGDFIAGEFSLADISVFPWVHVVLDTISSGKDLPALAAWRERVGARPAVRRVTTYAAGLRASDMKSFAAATPAQLARFFNRDALAAA